MAVIEVLYGESGWLRIVPPTMTNKEITAISSKVDFTSAVKVVANYVAPASVAATETKYAETTIANGNKLAVLDNAKTYKLSDGSEVVASSGGSTSYDTFECSVTASKTQIDSILTAYRAGNPVYAIAEIGKSPTTGAVAGYVYIFGVITDYKETPAQGAITYDFTITAKTFGVGNDFTIAADQDQTDFNAIATGGSNTITPLNDGSARTITALSSGDWSELAAGKIVRKGLS